MMKARRANRDLDFSAAAKQSVLSCGLPRMF
jgi:hypothetical protein